MNIKNRRYINKNLLFVLVFLFFVAGAGAVFAILLSVESSATEMAAAKKEKKAAPKPKSQEEIPVNPAKRDTAGQDAYDKQVRDSQTKAADTKKEERAFVRANVSSVVQALKSPAIAANEKAKKMLIKSLHDNRDIAIQVLTEEYNSNLPADTRQVITEALTEVNK